MANETKTFEAKNIIHREFLGDCFVSNRLVLLDGIYYNFKFQKPQSIVAKQRYKVVSNQGNQLLVAQV